MSEIEFKIEVGEYPKNSRYSVLKGTKFVQVMVPFEVHDSPWDAASKAVDLAFQTARSKWAFRHDEIDYTVTILTVQVLVELRWRT